MKSNIKSPNINYRGSAIAMGICYILAFVVYGTGATLIDTFTSGDNILATIAADNTRFITGAVLIAVLQPLFMAIPIIALPILKPHNQYFAYGYLATSIVSMLCLMVGAIILLMFIPLADQFTQNGSTITPFYQTLTAMLVAGGNYAYLIGMSIWPIGGLIFCVVLYKSMLVPRLLAVWGFIGYLVHFTGSISEMYVYDLTIQIITLAPGGLFEIAFAFWLIFKGFNVKSVLQNKVV